MTFQELTKAGFPVDASDAPTLRLFADGLEQAIDVTAGDDLHASDGVEFYGSAVDTPYTDGRVYWLVKGDRPGLRIQKTVVPPMSREPSLMSFPYTVEHRERSFYVMGIINGEEQNFFGRFIGPDGVDQTLLANHIDAGSNAVVEVRAQGLGVKHVLEVSLNGSVLGTLGMEPWQEGSAKLSVPSGILVEGENTLRLRSSQADGYQSLRHREADLSAMVRGRRRLAPHGPQRSRSARPPRSKASPADGSRDGHLNAGRPVELAGGVRLRTPATPSPCAHRRPRLGAGVRALFAFSAGQMKHPAAITANRPSHWRSELGGADVVMITTHDLEDALAPLAALRRSQGHSVAMVDVEDIYDEYSFGIKSPEAIRSFLLDASQRWQTAPRFVVLVGNGTYDPRDYLGLGGDLVPTMHVNTAEAEVPSDDWFADLDEDGTADLAIGRLPVETLQQASGVVSKLVQYEDSGRAFEKALFVADAAIGSNFQLINSRLLTDLPSRVTVDEVNVGDIGIPAARTRLFDELAAGVDLVHYSGHGSVDHLRGGLLTTADVASLGNADHPAVFTMMNCLVGMFDDPTMDSLGKALVNASTGGAVAVWASSGTTTAPDQEPMMAEFLSALDGLGGASTLGEAVMAGKAAAQNGDVRMTWVLLGDPATALR